MESKFSSFYRQQPDSKEKETFILRTIMKRDQLLDIDTYVFKGIDF